MSNLRSKVIRLAHQKPELRAALLPLLTERSRLASREIPVEISEVVDEIRGYVKAAARGIGWKFNGGDFGYSGKSYSFNIEDDKSNKVDLILDFSEYPKFRVRAESYFGAATKAADHPLSGFSSFKGGDAHDVARYVQSSFPFVLKLMLIEVQAYVVARDHSLDYYKSVVDTVKTRLEQNLSPVGWEVIRIRVDHVREEGGFAKASVSILGPAFKDAKEMATARKMLQKAFEYTRSRFGVSFALDGRSYFSQHELNFNFTIQDVVL